MAARPELLSESSGTDPARIMDEMARLSYLSRAIHVVADLGIADLIGPDNVSAAEIAERGGMHAASLERVLRFLSAYGVFSEAARGEFRNTALSDVLRQDNPQSIRPNLRRIGAAWWKAIGNLGHSLKTGGSAFTDANGASFFEYLAGNPEQQRRFDEGMA